MNSATIRVERDVQSEMRSAAEEFRNRAAERGTFVVQLISSPGAGKTSLLEATARHWSRKHRMAVLVGDIATERDALRLAPLTVVRQLTTGGACHLEFPLVAQGFRQLPPDDLDFLFIEDVGNLVCPASFDLGQHLRVVLLSVAEGDDKPGKYPKAFRTSQALVITKVDLLPHVPFSVERAKVDAFAIQPELKVLAVSPLTCEGVTDWCDWLEQQRAALSPRPS